MTNLINIKMLIKDIKIWKCDINMHHITLNIKKYNIPHTVLQNSILLQIAPKKIISEIHSSYP